MNFMIYIFLLSIIFSLQAQDVDVDTDVDTTDKDICDFKCETNKETAKLNKKSFVPTTSVTSSESSTTSAQNHLKVLSLLQKLQAILKAKEDVTFPEFSPNRPLRSSDKDDNIPALRQILQSLGYLDKATDSPFFDVELENAVKSFQAGHCLEPDGIIGDETKAKINWDYTKRLKMIDDSIAKIKNLVFANRTVIVNVPTYTMYAFEEEELKMRMKVIVGQSKRPTPIMTSYIDAIEYNPAWVVPETILFEDKLPKIQDDPEFFQKNDLDVFDHDENEVDPSTVEWSDVTVHDFPYIFKQKPGNSLGLYPQDA
jgi:L,D-transpeptidase YcbB